MTVAELIEELKALDPAALVVLQKDAEGNGYSPLAGADPAVYEAESTWSGQAYSEEDVADGYGEGCPPCVVLHPVN